ncbi:M61 family metallopeptidase [Brumimicrobium aurantiacum]|uniref:Peptidase M61 n=1 Tax=Brumimicrobium aurantiacum TaxID=1737063 RepID=A0A3E1F1M0_9FLAO|nr:hypothetical protein [Brumimicrobium aurantiacum]RFC55639.1 hypothetical protein DXU93_01525 [Brumimicrobium aurantiacum]
MKLSIICILLSIFICGNLYSQNDTIEVIIDLKNIKDDKVNVVLNFSQKKTKQVYALPYTIPGTYENLEYAKFINDFQVYGADDKKNILLFGDEKTELLQKYGLDQLETDRIKELFVFPETTRSIKYSVDDAYDRGKNSVKNFIPEACVFVKDELFQLNWGAVIGSFNSTIHNFYKISVIKPKNLYGATTLDKLVINDTLEVLYADNYYDLIDQPAFYAGADTSSISVNNSIFEVVVFSEDGHFYADKIASKLEPVLKTACNKYLKGIAPEKYIFMYYLTTGGAMGALEHKTSSVYFLSARKLLERSDLLAISAHEVLHVLTPLTVCSSEIGDFDANFPSTSKHLWMYEGVTEYLSQLMLMETDTVYSSYFLKTIGWNSRDAKKKFSMTKMSDNIYQKKWSRKYGTVYTKGALTAFALDVEIYSMTNGKMRLFDVMMELKSRYQDSYFSDDELINEIIEIVGDPNISTFFNRYISGRKALPLKKYLYEIGYEIKHVKVEKDGLWDGFKKRISFKGSRVFMRSPSKKVYGNLKCGRNIEVLSINGNTEVFENRMKLFSLKEGDYIECLCNGERKKVEIRMQERKHKYLVKKVVKLEESNEKQKTLFKEITKSEW